MSETTAVAPQVVEKSMRAEREALSPPERDRREVATNVLTDRYRKAVTKDGDPNKDPVASAVFSAYDMGNLSAADIGNDGLDCPTESSDQGEPIKLKVHGTDIEGTVVKIKSRKDNTYTVDVQTKDAIHRDVPVSTDEIRMANLVAERAKILTALEADPDAHAVVKAYLDEIDTTTRTEPKATVDDETLKRAAENLNMMSIEEAKSVVAVLAKDDPAMQDRLTALDGRLILDTSDVRDLLEGVEPEAIEDKKNETQTSWSQLRTERDEAEEKRKAAADAKTAAETAKGIAETAKDQDAIDAAEANITTANADITAAETQITDLNTKIDAAKNQHAILQKANRALVEAQESHDAEPGSPRAIADNALDIQMSLLDNVLQSLPQRDPRKEYSEADAKRERAEYMMAQLERARDLTDGRLMLYAKANAIRGAQSFAATQGLRGDFAQTQAEGALKNLSEGLATEQKAFVDFLKDNGVSEKVLKMASDPNRLFEALTNEEVMKLPAMSKELFGANAADAQAVLNDFIDNAAMDPAKRRLLKDKLKKGSKDAMWMVLIALAIGLGEAVMGSMDMAKAAGGGR